jgi:hypothetical protein
MIPEVQIYKGLMVTDENKTVTFKAKETKER